MALSEPQPSPDPIQWESFYRDYRKPGYIPGYEIQVQLGSGAFGIVFKATKESIGKAYAIKFLKVDGVELRNAVLRELDAVRYFAQIDHPNLVSIEDMGEVDGIPYIVMAFAGDDTLRRRIDAGELDRDQALAIFQQVARGVQALHEHSLVHFDIKPANVYLKGDVARIGDYGLSKLVTDSRNTLSMGRGTPFYMAPELLQRKGDARSDIYALGVMLYEMLVGEPPFQGASEWEVLRKHEEATVEIPPSVAEPERSVIERALEKAPDDRFESVAQMIEALGGTLPERPRPKRTTGRRLAPTSAARPHRPGRLLAVAVLGAGFAMLTVFWLLVSRPAAPSVAISAGVPEPIRPDPALDLRELAARLPTERHAQVLAAIQQCPTGMTDEVAFARFFTRSAGLALEPIVEAIEAIGTLEALRWGSLLRSIGKLPPSGGRSGAGTPVEAR